MKDFRAFGRLVLWIAAGGVAGCGLFCQGPWFATVRVTADESAGLELSSMDSDEALPVLRLEAVNSAGNAGVVDTQFKQGEDGELLLPSPVWKRVFCDDEEVCQPDAFTLHFDLVWDDGTSVDPNQFPKVSTGCGTSEIELWQGLTVRILCDATQQSIPCP
jgi:hypothetical protein